MSVQIDTRRELFSLFQKRLEDTQEDLAQEQSLEYDRKMLKTYIIESNISPNQFIQRSDIFEDARQIDENLFEFQLENEEEKEFYLDSKDDRFWSLYTLVGSQLARQTFTKLTTENGNGLDRPWIPNDTQKEILDLGEFKGAGMNQHGKKAFPEDFLDVSDFRLELEGDDAERFYTEFDEHSDIQKILSLSRIKIRTVDGDDFLTQRITNEGAFTARGGTNIDIHFRTVDNVKKKYRRLINAIESNHRINYEGVEGRVQVEGKHIRIDLTNPIEDIQEFLSHLVNAKKPFRLMGPSTKIDDNYYKVRAIDLHNGDKVTLEIGRKWMRLYLYDQACGNTALRIFTNIQHFYDPSSIMHIEGVENV